MITVHGPILPLILPLAVAILLLFLPRRAQRLTRGLSVAGIVAQVGLGLLLLRTVADGTQLVYRLGDWPAPYGIMLVVDRLAAWLLLTSALLALCALIYALAGGDRQGRYFHVLFQMQIFGISGAFVTGDLFNLFVFFEVLLIASYSLLLHGGGGSRTRAGLHYVILNLLGSAIFLLAAGLIYSSCGSLNFAHLAQLMAGLDDSQQALARTGGLLLLVVFALKAGIMPLHLWLPAAYAETSAPIAALFAIMTKIGLYAILRMSTLVFGSSAGSLTGLYLPWLLPLALLTLLIGAAGALAADRLGRLAAYLIILSVGTLLTAFAGGTVGIAAGLYYLPHSTFAAASLFLCAGALRRSRPVIGDQLIADGDLPQPLIMGGTFFLSAMAISGLPPFSGFISKLLILQALPQVLVWGVILTTALAAVIALARGGSQIFLAASGPMTLPRDGHSDLLSTRPWELTAITGLLILIFLLTMAAGPALEFTQDTARQILEPANYIQAVLGGGS
jgi:multicomponent K+:H+ antiporter subunit D